MSDPSSTALDVLAQKANEGVLRSLTDAWDAYAVERASNRSPFAAAVLVAARGDRLGQAFAVGYPAALEELVPGVGLPSALCVTESEGNSPRAISTALSRERDHYRLDGEKTFVTFGTLAETLIIVARAGVKPDGRPDLAVVRIPSERDGVSLQELPPTPFVPEVTHARLKLEGVLVRREERLPGDGYLRYVKPFRTIEDIHVVGATLGYLIGLAVRTDAPRAWVATLAAALSSLENLRSGAPLDPRVHVALHGVYRSMTEVVSSPELSRVLADAPSEERRRWERDHALLRIASKARAARFERAASELF